MESPSSSISLDSISSFNSSYTPLSEVLSDFSPGISPLSPKLSENNQKDKEGKEEAGGCSASFRR